MQSSEIAKYVGEAIIVIILGLVFRRQGQLIQAISYVQGQVKMLLALMDKVNKLDREVGILEAKSNAAHRRVDEILTSRH